MKMFIFMTLLLEKKIVGRKKRYVHDMTLNKYNACDIIYSKRNMLSLTFFPNQNLMVKLNNN